MTVFFPDNNDDADGGERCPVCHEALVTVIGEPHERISDDTLRRAREVTRCPNRDREDHRRIGV